MKKVLFVTTSMENNGATISLINLLKAIDYSLISVDLLFFDNTETNLSNLIPEQVRVLMHCKELGVFWLPFKEAIRQCIRIKRFDLMLYRVGYTANKKIWNSKRNVQCLQQICNKIIPSISHRWDTVYDVAISYQDFFPALFIEKCIQADKKIGWNHSVYTCMGYDNLLYQEVIKGLDALATISQITKQSLVDTFGKEVEGKIFVVSNKIDYKKIRQMCQLPISEQSYGQIKPTMLSVGRLTAQKGYDMLIDVLAELQTKGYEFSLYILGDGEDKGILQKRIDALKLTNRVHLLGNKENPYSFMAACDCYLQPSRYEGYGIAIDEANYFGKTMIVTSDVKERFNGNPRVELISFHREKWRNALEKYLLEYSTGGKEIECTISVQDNMGDFYSLIN